MYSPPKRGNFSPVLHQSSSSMHAIVTTPAEPLGALIARFPRDSGLPRITDGSASAFPFSRPTRRSLTLRPAYSSSHQVALCTGELSSRLTPWAAAPITTGWSDICRAGFAPAERPCLCTAHGRNRGNLNGRSEKLKKDQLLANQFDSNPGSHFILYFNSVRLISHLD